MQAKNGDMFHRKDKIEIKPHGVRYDKDGRIIHSSDGYALLSDSCFIEQSGAAVERTGADGVTYSYSFVVHSNISDLPKKGDVARLTKADGTLTIELEVKDSWYYPNIGKSRIWL